MLIVQKYGGTSVGSVERIAAVARHIRDTQAAGHRIVVTVSAMAGETNRLLALVGRMGEHPSDRESDVVVSTGEQVSAGLVTLAVQQLGVPAISLLSHQIPIITDGIYGRARIEWIHAEPIQQQLAADQIVVIPGFQGVDSAGHMTTLGRGGSDTSAVALAAALQADRCEIYTDVDGIFTTDPRDCPHARMIQRMDYEELLEMAGAGAKVMHTRAIQLGARYRIPLEVRSAMETAMSGTCVEAEDPRVEATLVTGISATRNEAKVVLRGVPIGTGIAHRFFSPLARANINVDMIVATTNADGESEIGFTVAKEDLRKTMQITEGVARELGVRNVEAAGDISKVSIIGLGMRCHAGVAARMFDALAQAGINIQLISTSEIKVSVVVNMDEAAAAVQALHTVFGLDATTAVLPRTS
ncbi:MAG: aspartate kinase [Deltaproteobacteria bacterium]|nr:aspartate kinase [Deltaproteobacteria bacterium]